VDTAEGQKGDDDKGGGIVATILPAKEARLKSLNESK
jgi:hypothetical protein